MRIFTKGDALTVFITDEGLESLPEAEGRVPPNREACKAQLRARLKQLAQMGTLRNPDLMNSEGDGIHAVKTNCGLRVYGWFGSDEDKNKAFFIAHVAMKKQQKARKSDLDAAKAARDRIRGER